jgi:hypothetical protein
MLLLLQQHCCSSAAAAAAGHLALSMGSSLTASIVAAAGVDRIGALVGQMGGEVTGGCCCCCRCTCTVADRQSSEHCTHAAASAWVDYSMLGDAAFRWRQTRLDDEAWHMRVDGAAPPNRIRTSANRTRTSANIAANTPCSLSVSFVLFFAAQQLPWSRKWVQAPLASWLPQWGQTWLPLWYTTWAWTSRQTLCST